ncbi:asparagine synthase C-terminal domain-containing protein [Paenibacillus sp. PL2-23]|uniref:asparagine synthase C-terminal domain-containing protein n=1 Tax=Paenibacillus sp. PL2-23 TaxID=2100729 RepID=UPI0030F4C9FE
MKLFNRSFLAHLDLDNARKQSFLEALAEAPRLNGESDENLRMRTVSYLNLTRFLQTLLDRLDRMSMAHGLEVRVPFLDHQLVEYVFNVPWNMKSFDGREKSLLRAAMKNILPDSILQRNKNPYPAVQESQYESGLRHMLQQVLEDRNAPIWPLLDKDKVKNELQRNSSGVSLPYSRGSLEMCLWLNMWLDKYKVEIEL